ncbi:MAG: rhodanese-related sulfurtransferase [Leptolyngbyaceae cyanobacterium SL_7_1]|nr:rhodanese-related sulfurtransferase [Leptolyngbyaceae cyanobacterium SL_7_1]
MCFTVATFYKFIPLPDAAELRGAIEQICQQENIKGTILLASEGINGTIAGSATAIEQVLTFLRGDSRLADLEYKRSLTDTLPFNRLKVKLKPEIVTMGIPQVSPIDRVGTPVDPSDWNALISDPNVLVIDTRKPAEIKVGTFKGAHNPRINSFRDFPDYVRQLDPAKHSKIAMFCTGGIRCEKASAYMLNQGFQEVYQLKGGILKYLEEIPPEQSLWQGECFVFDQRVALDHQLESGTHRLCNACGHPLSESDRQSPLYQAGVGCPFCADARLSEADGLG